MGFFSSLFGSKTETTQSKDPFESNPWEPQRPYLEKGFEEAQGALGQAQENMSKVPGMPGMNQTQKDALGGLAKQGQTFNDGTQSIMQNLMSSASSGPTVQPNANLDAFSKNAAAMASGGNPQSQSIFDAAGNLVSTNQATENRDTIMGMDSNAGSLYGDVSADKTDAILANAKKYSDNPALQESIDAALRDITRNFKTEQGNINSAAMATGNVNSSRAGTLEAIAARDAMDRAGDISSTMRSDAYLSGIDSAMSAEGMRQSGALNANAQVQGDNSLKANGILGATDQLIKGEQGALGLQLDANGQQINTNLAGNAQLGSAANMTAQQQQQAQANFGNTLNQIAQTYGMSVDGLMQKLQSGDRFQQQDIAEMQDAFTKAGVPLDLVGQYMQAIGGSYGSEGFQTTSTTTKSPSIFQQVAGAAAGIAGVV